MAFHIGPEPVRARHSCCSARPSPSVEGIEPARAANDAMLDSGERGRDLPLSGHSNNCAWRTTHLRSLAPSIRVVVPQLRVRRSSGVTIYGVLQARTRCSLANPGPGSCTSRSEFPSSRFSNATCFSLNSASGSKAKLEPDQIPLDDGDDGVPLDGIATWK